MSHRLVVVSNRVASIQEGKATAGGLSVAVLEALRELGGLWFGWSGATSASSSADITVTRAGPVSTAVMPLTKVDYDEYYRGYSNSTIWPLFHYRANLVENHRKQYEGYRRVNALFAARLAPLLQDDDLIWIHDYHLIPMGLELRRSGSTHRIGFFLHIPFPPPSVLRCCTEHADLMRALCAYDVVGFQTADDLNNFQAYVTNVAGGRVHTNGDVEVFGQTLVARVYPIGVYPDELAATATRSAAGRHATRLKQSLGGRDMMIGVDRLDYSKGLDNRFAAYEHMLTQYPDNRGRVTFLQIAPPSRSDVQTYREIRRKLEAMAGSINGRFAEYDWIPLRYLNKGFQRDQLMGFFRVAAVCLVTPLRDGMNLVAKEFVASQDPNEPGALVLSQFAGAANELTSAVIVNPYDTEDTALGMQRALNMSLEERRERYQDMMSALQRFDLAAWRQAFVNDLIGEPVG